MMQKITADDLLDQGQLFLHGSNLIKRGQLSQQDFNTCLFAGFAMLFSYYAQVERLAEQATAEFNEDILDIASRT
jgi:hypothetical protein